MRLKATKNGHIVIIVSVLYEGEDNENLKAVYVDEDGEIDAADVAEFTIDTGDYGEMTNLKVKTW